jgi:hypothetical protein
MHQPAADANTGFRYLEGAIEGWRTQYSFSLFLFLFLYFRRRGGTGRLFHLDC